MHARIEPRADDSHLGLGLLGGDRLQRVEVAACESRDAGRNRRRLRREGVEDGHVELDDASSPGGPAAGRERRAQGHRDLAEELPRLAHPDHAFFAVDHLGDLGAPFDHHEERTLIAFVREVLARKQVDVLDRPREVLEGLGGERSEDRDAAQPLDGDHAGDSCVIGHSRPVAATTNRIIRRTYRRGIAASTLAGVQPASPSPRLRRGRSGTATIARAIHPSAGMTSGTSCHVTTPAKTPVATR